MKNGCLDFVSGKPADIATYFQESLDIHHIFPQNWCNQQGIDPKNYNSIINKTPLSKRTNIRVGGDAPSAYLQQIEQQDEIARDRLDDILRTHMIEPSLLRLDDFEGFFKARADALAVVIGKAMDKPVVEEEGTNEPEEESNEAIESEELEVT